MIWCTLHLRRPIPYIISTQQGPVSPHSIDLMIRVRVHQGWVGGKSKGTSHALQWWDVPLFTRTRFSQRGLLGKASARPRMLLFGLGLCCPEGVSLVELSVSAIEIVSSHYVCVPVGRIKLHQARKWERGAPVQKWMKIDPRRRLLSVALKGD